MLDILAEFFGVFGLTDFEGVTLVEFFPWFFKVLFCLALVILVFRLFSDFGKLAAGKRWY